MGILIFLSITQLLHQLGRCISKMKRNRQVPCLSHQGQGRVDTLVSRVTLRAGSQIDRSFRQRYPSFRPANLHDSIKGCIGQKQGIGIGQADIFGSRDNQAPGNEGRVLSSLHHTGQPIKRPIGITSTDGLDEGRDDVVMQLPILIISQRILLKTLHYLFIGNNHLARRAVSFHHQFQNVQQLPGISSRIAEHGIRLLQFDILFLQIDILGDGIVQQFEQVFLLQRLEHIELAPREQRTNDLERRILRCGSNQRHDSRLHSTQQRILLRLAETMDFINKKDRTRLIEETTGACLLNDIAYILHPTGHRTECIERSLQLVGDNLCQGCLSHPRRSPKDKRRDAPRINHLAENSPLTHEVLLPDIIIQRLGAQTLCQRLCHKI